MVTPGSFVFAFYFLFIFGCAVFLVALGVSPAVGSRAYSLVAVHWLLTCCGFSCWGAQSLGHMG